MCCKKDAAFNYKKKSKNVWFIEAERRRGREKYKRLNYKEKYPPDKLKSNAKTKNLHRYLISAGYDMNMKEAHHWNYDLPKQGFILTRNINRALDNLEKSLSTFVIPYEIVKIEDTKFVEVIPYIPDDKERIPDNLKPQQ